LALRQESFLQQTVCFNLYSVRMLLIWHLVAATLFWGDVRHTADQSYNIGSGSDKDGVWPRSELQLEALNEYSDVLRSWCTAEDPYCAGGDRLKFHVDYFRLQSEEAAEFVGQKVEEYRASRTNN
jgi:hypothetical protein